MFALINSRSGSMMLKWALQGHHGPLVIIIIIIIIIVCNISEYFFFCR